jgi:protein-tyrosine phosphatase
MNTAAQRTVLFLCTGNYYRSRFAELLFNAVAARRGIPWQSESRGLRLNPANVGPLSRHAVRALERLGISLSDDRRFPLQVTEADLQAAHLVVAVKETEHRPLLQQHFPTWADRVEYWHIHDLDCAGPDEALTELEAKVFELTRRFEHDP